MKYSLFLVLFFSAIKLNAQCVSNFSLNPSTGCSVPYSVFFTDLSTLPDTWLWNFGDGSTSTSKNPIHNYTVAGGFKVTLRISDTMTGCTSVHVDSVKIGVPTADFSSSGTFGCAPFSTSFTNTSFNSGYGNLSSWAWDFGDGSTSNSQNPSHTYNSPGTYNVSLTVTNSLGCTITKNSTNYIQVIGPDVNFGSSDTIADCIPHTVIYKDSTSFGAPITSWTWNFGDGNSSSLQNPSHVYTNYGNYSVSLKVNDLDGCSRTLTFTDYVKINDNSNPTINCPGNQNVNLDGSCQYSLLDYTSLATFSDNCSVTVTQSPVAGTLIASSQTVTLTATDGVGNSTNCSFDVVPTDNTPPTINCPGNQNVNFDGSCQYSLLDYTSLGTFSDNCSVTVTQSPLAGTIIASSQTITLTATDGTGNSANCSFDVVPTDNIFPTISCPGNQNVNLDGNCQFTLPDYTAMATANDNCTFAVSQSPVIGSIITTNQTITLTVADGAGNVSTCSFAVIVSDNINPTITCPGDVTQNNDLSSCGAIVNYSSPVFSDNCSGASMTQNTGLASGALFPIGTTVNTYEVVDGAGNTATCSSTVIVIDNELPTIICPPAIQSCDSIITFSDPVVADNCSGESLVLTSGIPSNNLFPLGLTTNTYTVTDAAGNTNSCFFDITRYVQPYVDAGANVQINAGNSIALSPTSTNATTFDWSPSVGLNDPTIESPEASPQENTIYTLTVTSDDGCQAADDVEITVDVEVEVNNFMSPNGDGKNDTWIIKGNYLLTDCTIQIFDSWGNKLMESIGYQNDWDADGLPEGNYFYVITCKSDQPITGSVTLIR